MTAQERESLLERIAAHAEDVPEIQTALTACRAVGPENGGHGEGAKAGLIEKWLRDMGISGIEHVDAPDGRVPGGKRPNLIATIPGRSSRSLWLFAHMDVVPEGDPALWNTDPWKVTRKGDMLYGRGVEDNQCPHRGRRHAGAHREARLHERRGMRQYQGARLHARNEARTFPEERPLHRA